MNNEYYVDPIFSDPIYNSKINLDLKPYVGLSLIEKQNSHSVDEDGKTLDNPTRVSTELYILNNEKFKNLKNEILTHLNVYTKDILKYTNNFKITTSWITYTNPGSRGILHRHRNSLLSGIVYLQTNENSGNIIFEKYKNVNDFYVDRKEHNLFNSELWYYKPFDNKIVIFPSDIFHRIDKNKSNILRISIAFNAVPVGTFGMSDSALTIK